MKNKKESAPSPKFVEGQKVFYMQNDKVLSSPISAWHFHKGFIASGAQNVAKGDFKEGYFDYHLEYGGMYAFNEEQLFATKEELLASL